MIAQRLTAAAHKATQVWTWVRGIPLRSRAARLDRAQIAAAEQHTANLEPARRLQDLLTFYDRYEDLVEVLCDAAQYGPEPKLEARYAESRVWMQTHYRSIRKFVVGFMKLDPADAAQGFLASGQGTDAFESLFSAATLEEFLRVDDGLMIDRIERTREALALYGEHLRAANAA
ncbi:MAG TPA: hypothetical protein PLO61_11135 [Fimbriimonadaceae bacterium]|nr:hypothetical protein [Fimbriimonadaceae bacterium]HRJ34155.1 hypothetical protein [Fimbriimonadaceae bacterium]